VMQIDLQQPLDVDSIKQDGDYMTMQRDGNALFVILRSPQKTGESRTISVYYRGQPRAALRAPWDGGFVWATDSLGRPWIATASASSVTPGRAASRSPRNQRSVFRCDRRVGSGEFIHVHGRDAASADDDPGCRLHAPRGTRPARREAGPGAGCR